MPLQTDDLRWNAKTVEGLALFNWLEQISNEEKQNYFKAIADDVKNGSPLFGTNVVKEVNFD